MTGNLFLNFSLSAWKQTFFKTFPQQENDPASKMMSQVMEEQTQSKKIKKPFEN